MRIRRSRTLLVSWRDGKLVFTNYRTRRSASGAPVTMYVLQALENWVYPSDFFAAFSDYSLRSLRDAIRLLRRHSLIVEEGTRDAIEDERIERVWANWLPGGSFHFLTKDVEFVNTGQYDEMIRRYLEESPQPKQLKTYPKAAFVELETDRIPDGEFAQVLMSRRTHRNFSAEYITSGTVSKLLYYTWGVQSSMDSTLFGRLFHKTSPSAGARHPGEVYLLAIRVEGLKAGLYHYDGLNHRLEWLRTVSAKKKAVDYTAGHEFLKDASALFIMTAVFPRVQWKYRFARAYRVVLLDAGHLCQTFCLVATWLGLSPFCTAALRDTLIEKDLGIDGIDESVLYVAGVGVSLPSKTSKRR